MAVGDKNVAIGCDEDIGWRIECVGTSAGDTELTKRRQDLPVRRELHDGVVSSVGDPDGAVRNGEQAVRPTEQSGPKAHDEPACCVEFLNRRDVRAVAALTAAAVEHPYAREAFAKKIKLPKPWEQKTAYGKFPTAWITS